MSDAALEELIDRVTEALDEGDLEAAGAALDDAKARGGENHPHVLHMAGMVAWERGDTSHALGFLMQAMDQGPDKPMIYLDGAECLMAAGESIDEAEAAVAMALKLESITEQERNEAFLLLAQIRLNAEDPDEALEHLEKISPDLHGHGAFLATKAAVMDALERFDEAAEALKAAIAQEPGEPDFHYHLGIVLEHSGRSEEAVEAMLKVLELDLAADRELGDMVGGPPSFAEIQQLRGALEDVFEGLPDPLLRLVANAPITVQDRATADQVRAGMDPRATIAFLGTPKQSDADDDDSAQLDGIVVMRDLLVTSIEDDEDIPEALIEALVDELRGFFRLSDVVVESV
jgi:tetratricopeptide (TPR) repeat protein